MFWGGFACGLLVAWSVATVVVCVREGYVALVREAWKERGR